MRAARTLRATAAASGNAKPAPPATHAAAVRNAQPFAGQPCGQRRQRQQYRRPLQCRSLRDNQRLDGGEATPQSRRMPPDLDAHLTPEQKVANKLNRGFVSLAAPPVPGPATVTKAPPEERNAPGRRLLQVEFNCNPCGARSRRNVNPYALKNGTVVVACASCGTHHLLADHLRQFDMDDMWHTFPSKRSVDVNDVRAEDHPYTPEDLPSEGGEDAGRPEEPARLSEAQAQAAADAATADLLARRERGRINRQADALAREQGAGTEHWPRKEF